MPRPENDDPTPGEAQAGHWLELIAEGLLLFKKIACCPRSQRLDLMQSVNEFAASWIEDLD